MRYCLWYSTNELPSQICNMMGHGRNRFRPVLPLKPLNPLNTLVTGSEVPRCHFWSAAKSAQPRKAQDEFQRPNTANAHAVCARALSARREPGGRDSFGASSVRLRCAAAAGWRCATGATPGAHGWPAVALFSGSWIQRPARSRKRVLWKLSRTQDTAHVLEMLMAKTGN